MAKEVVIWGTGRKAEKLMAWLEENNACVRDLLGGNACEIKYYVDSDPNKVGTLFYSKRVRFPEIASIKQMILVAVLYDGEICERLDKAGVHRGEGYLRLGDIRRWFWSDLRLLERACEIAMLPDDNNIVKRMNGENCITITCGELESFWQNIDKLSDEYAKKLHLVLLCTIFASSHSWDKQSEVAAWALQKVGAAVYANLLENVFGQNKASASVDWLPPLDTRQCYMPKVIGIYYPRYYNGGIERVLSRLIPIYLVHGYQVVLFTDEIREDLEYELPTGVKRVLLGYDGGRLGRSKRLLLAVEKYHIDIFCNHAIWRNAIYDVFCVQSMHVPVVQSLHNIFSVAIKQMGKELLALLKRAEVVVVLSKADQLFWKLLGCCSIYIPNLVAPPLIGEQNTVLGRFNVLWIQRIEDVQKRVLDLPDILDELLKIVPDARLQIAGRADDPTVESKLKQMLEKRDLLDHVDFLGFSTEIGKFYKEADVMLMTSAYEGFPMTIVESKQYGVPIVLYELPYLELLKDRKGYIAVPQQDKKAAAKAIAKILLTPSLKTRLSNEARDSLKYFSEIDIAIEWEAAFELAIGRKKQDLLSDKEKSFQIIETLLLESLDGSILEQ